MFNHNFFGVDVASHDDCERWAKAFVCISWRTPAVSMLFPFLEGFDGSFWKWNRVQNSRSEQTLCKVEVHLREDKVW